MAEKEIYDYLDTIAPDRDLTLSIKGRGTLLEEISKIDAIHESPDGQSESVINFGGTKICAQLSIPYNNLDASDRGSIMQYFADSAYGDGRKYSFKLAYSDGHTYVVKFRSMFKCQWRGVLYSMPVVFKVLGRIAD